ncbi:MAG: rod shape-determining protein MreC [Defluviitaleaceae bacterium]|nr:rod shape-determining protein MreC [Defluviitaleaceae bacterium]
MNILIQRKKTIFALTALLCIAMSVVTLNFRRPTFFENMLLFVISPAQDGVTSITGWLEGQIDFVSNMHELERTNQRLLEENQRMRLELAHLEMLERENERLTTQIGLVSNYPALDLEFANVIASDFNNWSSHFLINRGTNNGILENMAIVADGGLVGRVHRAYARSALVVPIIDDTSAVSAQIRRTGEFGFARGDIRLWEQGFIRMENIDADADVLENDEIITSTLGEIYPHGITIGHVREIHMDPGGLTKHAIIQPVVDFRQLSVVKIVINSLESPLLPGYYDDIDDVDTEEEEE